MIKVFIDASVLFAAVLSPTGGSREILRLAFHGKLQLVANQLVIDEVRRNLTLKVPDTVEYFTTVTEALPWELVEPKSSFLTQVLPHTVPKDAPHLASALQAQVFCLVSHDRQHMVNLRHEIKKHLKLKILTPGDLLQHMSDTGQR